MTWGFCKSYGQFAKFVKLVFGRAELCMMSHEVRSAPMGAFVGNLINLVGTGIIANCKSIVGGIYQNGMKYNDSGNRSA